MLPFHLVLLLFLTPPTFSADCNKVVERPDNRSTVDQVVCRRKVLVGVVVKVHVVGVKRKRVIAR